MKVLAVFLLLFFLILTEFDFYGNDRHHLLEKLDKQWNGEIGLWRGGVRLDSMSHSIRANAAKLVAAGEAGLLNKVEHERVLRNLLRAQETQGRYKGNFWWAWEDKKVKDRNSVFFTVLQLLALHYEHRDQLTLKSQQLLSTLLKHSTHALRGDIYPIEDHQHKAANSYLGKIVCLWLVSEIHGAIDKRLAHDFQRVLKYYVDSNWGTGEHLSDIYSKVLQRALVALLMWERQLPRTIEADVVDMMSELSQIDAWYKGGPRVPAIRNYWLDRTPGTSKNLPAVFLPFMDFESRVSLSGFTIGTIANRRGVFDRIKIDDTERRAIAVPTYGTSSAYAWVDDRWRLGVLSRYPFFPEKETHARWGHAWQSLPVNFWHSNGDWGFLQWAVQEHGKVHAHPAMHRNDVRLEHLARLSDTDPQATVANTFGIREGKSFLVIRSLPKIGRDWAWVADRLRFFKSNQTKVFSNRWDGWYRLSISFEQETLTVAYYPLTGASTLASLEDERSVLWGPKREIVANSMGPMVNLWYFSVGDVLEDPPTVEGAGIFRTIKIENGPEYTIDTSREMPWVGLQLPTASE